MVLAVSPRPETRSFELSPATLQQLEENAAATPKLGLSLHLKTPELKIQQSADCLQLFWDGVGNVSSTKRTDGCFRSSVQTQLQNRVASIPTVCDDRVRVLDKPRQFDEINVPRFELPGCRHFIESDEQFRDECSDKGFLEPMDVESVCLIPKRSRRSIHTDFYKQTILSPVQQQENLDECRQPIKLFPQQYIAFKYEEELVFTRARNMLQHNGYQTMHVVPRSPVLLPCTPQEYMALELHQMHYESDIFKVGSLDLRAGPLRDTLDAHQGGNCEGGNKGVITKIKLKGFFLQKSRFGQARDEDEQRVRREVQKQLQKQSRVRAYKLFPDNELPSWAKMRLLNAKLQAQKRTLDTVLASLQQLNTLTRPWRTDLIAQTAEGVPSQFQSWHFLGSQCVEILSQLDTLLADHQLHTLRLAQYRSQHNSTGSAASNFQLNLHLGQVIRELIEAGSQTAGLLSPVAAAYYRGSCSGAPSLHMPLDDLSPEPPARHPRLSRPFRPNIAEVNRQWQLRKEAFSRSARSANIPTLEPHMDTLAQAAFKPIELAQLPPGTCADLSRHPDARFIAINDPLNGFFQQSLYASLCEQQPTRQSFDAKRKQAEGLIKVEQQTEADEVVAKEGASTPKRQCSHNVRQPWFAGLQPSAPAVRPRSFATEAREMSQAIFASSLKAGSEAKPSVEGCECMQVEESPLEMLQPAALLPLLNVGQFSAGVVQSVMQVLLKSNWCNPSSSASL